MLIVPLQPTPSQAVSVQLGTQSVNLVVQQRTTGLFIDVFVGTTAIIRSVLCENLNRIVRNAYLGLIGDFTFIDNEGTDDPIYTGLGGRFSLAYLEPSDLPAEE